MLYNKGEGWKKGQIEYVLGLEWTGFNVQSSDLNNKPFCFWFGFGTCTYPIVEHEMIKAHDRIGGFEFSRFDSNPIILYSVVQLSSINLCYKYHIHLGLVKTRQQR